MNGNDRTIWLHERVHVRRYGALYRQLRAIVPQKGCVSIYSPLSPLPPFLCVAQFFLLATEQDNVIIGGGCVLQVIGLLQGSGGVRDPNLLKRTSACQPQRLTLLLLLLASVCVQASAPSHPENLSQPPFPPPHPALTQSATVMKRSRTPACSDIGGMGKNAAVPYSRAINS